jgi:hypothetical protein
MAHHLKNHIRGSRKIWVLALVALVALHLAAVWLWTQRAGHEGADEIRRRGVSVRREGASFSRTPEAGARRIRGTTVLAGSRHDVYPWERDDFEAMAYCVDAAGSLVLAQNSGSGVHSSGQTRRFDAACPPGTTAGKYQIMDSDDHSEVWLEWSSQGS